jgi:CRISPR-associated protein Csd1
MLLERLKDYADRIRDRIAPPGYDNMAIKWIIQLDEQGILEGPLIATEGRGGKNDRGKEFMAPHRLRTSTSIRPKLLIDNIEYIFGIPKKSSATARQQKRADACRHAFVDLVRLCANHTGEPAVFAALKFLESGDVLPALKNIDPSHNLTFRVGNIFPIQLPKVQQFWADYFWEAVLAGEAGTEIDEDSESETESEDLSSRTPRAEMECIVCGNVRPAAPRHPFQIKGLPGRRGGAALISANSSAFESYGLTASLIAPTCRECAEVYVKAANALIEGREETSITVGQATYIFWTKEEHSISVARLLSNPEAAEVRSLINSVFSAQQSNIQLDPTPFYAAALTANRSRVVVRDWLEATVEEVRKNLARWFQLQFIVGEWGEPDAGPFPIQGYLNKRTKRWVEGLAESIVPKIKGRRDTQNAPPNILPVLLRTALKGNELPQWILMQAVGRNRAEQGITRSRASLIKMVLLFRQPNLIEENIMVKLDPENQDPAYLCGRLFAILEAVQRNAIPRSNTTITERFFGTASSAPASVFGRLLRGAQPHLSKLRKEKRGTYAALQKCLEDVQAGLTTFPRILTLEQQGLFSLGYYHQRASDRGAAIVYRQAHGQEDIDLELSKAD